MVTDVLKNLLEAGVHFGHQTRRWNPKMKKYIFGERSGIYIIDLEKTVEALNVARDFVSGVVGKGGKVLFVGTKKQAADVIATEAQRCQMPYVNHRWMGGLLTNFQTVRKSLDKLFRLEAMAEDGTLANLKKKEVAKIELEKAKLNRDLGGIREMKDLPKAIFIVDSKREDIAVQEANRLGIPVVGLIDTNCDPDFIDYPIPGNDDALKSIRYVASLMTDAIVEGQKEYATAAAIQVKSDKDTGNAGSSSSEDSAAPASSQE